MCIKLAVPLLFLILQACIIRPTTESTKDIRVRTDFNAHFDACGVSGTSVIYDVKNQTWTTNDTSTWKNEDLPASSFKIINLLISLETGVIKDENEVIPWVGSTDTVKYGYRPEIYKDMSVKEAFEVSAGWVFTELSKKIGKERYLHYLEKCKYGNMNLSEPDPDFWNYGEFAISPKNQVEFLYSLYTDKLPFSKRNMAIVKKVMVTEQNADYTLHAKTGWTRANAQNVGWWVGYIETRSGDYLFATRLRQDRKYNRADFGSCRKEITKKVMKELGIAL
jgi:beta-lactamase class D